jgi:hypothetical protein
VPPLFIYYMRPLVGELEPQAVEGVGVLGPDQPPELLLLLGRQPGRLVVL